jgi:hypothetical protein
MDDRFMNQLREEPRPGFARALRQRLRAGEGATTAPRRVFPLRTLLATAAGLAVVASLVLFPSVRASAQAFLDLFRVRQFTAVSFDATRLERFRKEGDSNSMLMFAKTEKLQDPGPPRVFTDAGAAGAAAGFAVRVPGLLPGGLVADTVTVSGAGAARMSVDTQKLRSLLEALDIRDVTVPDDLDGKSVTVHTTPIVFQQFHSATLHAHLAQAKSPEVELPAGLELNRLGAIGLRILGVSPADARRLATTIDWRSTLVVPVPVNAGSFREVTVHGQKGLLVTQSGQNADGQRERVGAVVMWTEGDQIYALGGDLARDELLQMAESVR